MHGSKRRKPDELDAERTKALPARPGTGASVQPLLQLQATIGNAAVAQLIRDRAGTRLTVQRLWDTEDEENVPSEQAPTEEGPVEDTGDATPAVEGEGSGDGPPAEEGPDRFAAVEGEVSSTLEPSSVQDTLSALETPDSEMGDFNVPDTGVVAQAMHIQRDNTPAEPPPTREGKPGDIIKALKPFLEPALKFLEENVLAALKKIKAGEAVVTVVVAAPIIIGPLTQPGPRKLALDQLDGTDITFGVIPNLQLKPQISDGQLKGGTLTYDLAPALRKAGIPF